MAKTKIKKKSKKKLSRGGGAGPPECETLDRRVGNIIVYSINNCAKLQTGGQGHDDAMTAFDFFSLLLGLINKVCMPTGHAPPFTERLRGAGRELHDAWEAGRFGD